MLDGESVTTSTHKWNGHTFIKKEEEEGNSHAILA